MFPFQRTYRIFLPCGNAGHTAIKNNTRPIADIQEGHISTASCILANLSMDLERPLVYDPSTRTVLNDPEATKLLQRAYRGPWEHPHPDTV